MQPSSAYGPLRYTDRKKTSAAWPQQQNQHEMTLAVITNGAHHEQCALVHTTYTAGTLQSAGKGILVLNAPELASMHHEVGGPFEARVKGWACLEYRGIKRAVQI